MDLARSGRLVGLIPAPPSLAPFALRAPASLDPFPAVAPPTPMTSAQSPAPVAARPSGPMSSNFLTAATPSTYSSRPASIDPLPAVAPTPSADRLPAVGARPAVAPVRLDLETLWTRCPRLVGGLPSLTAATGISHVATSVLVLADGDTTLQILKNLSPQLSQIEFGIIIRDAVRRGLLTFD